MRGLRGLARALTSLKGSGSSDAMVRGFAALASQGIPAGSVSFARMLTTSAPSRMPIHVEDEVYNRQRSIVPLEDLVPEPSPDSWVAPSAIVVGDVDIADKVSRLRGSNNGDCAPRRDQRGALAETRRHSTPLPANKRVLVPIMMRYFHHIRTLGSSVPARPTLGSLAPAFPLDPSPYRYFRPLHL